MMMKACRILLTLYVTGTATGQITPAELATHNKPTDCWTAIGTQVYDIADFIGGADGGHPNTQIYEACGIDGTSKYNNKHQFKNYINTKAGVVKVGTYTAPSGGCFSSATTVQLDNGERIAMHQLQVGDKIQVDHGKFEAVYGFAHRDAAMETNFLKIGWKVGKKNAYVEMTPGHMLLASTSSNKDWKMIPASMAKVGDEITVAHENERIIAKIRSIEHAQSNGAYAPLTFSGKVVANDLYASAYVSFQNSEHLTLGSGTQVKVSLQWIMQTYMLPFRWFGTLVAAPMGMDILWWLPSFLELGEHVFALPAPLLLLLVVPAVTVMGVASAMEWFLLAMVFENKLVAMMTVGTLVALATLWKKSGYNVRPTLALKKVV